MNDVLHERWQNKESSSFIRQWSLAAENRRAFATTWKGRRKRYELFKLFAYSSYPVVDRLEMKAEELFFKTLAFEWKKLAPENIHGVWTDAKNG